MQKTHSDIAVFGMLLKDGQTDRQTDSWTETSCLETVTTHDKLVHSSGKFKATLRCLALG